jgi:cell division protein FtsL
MSREKKQRKKRSLKFMFVGLALMGLFIGELLLYTWSRVQCVRTRYEISEQAKEQKRLVAFQDNLKIELARLKSPQRIAKIAKTQLGLIIPKPSQMILVPKKRWH